MEFSPLLAVGAISRGSDGLPVLSICVFLRSIGWPQDPGGQQVPPPRLTCWPPRQSSCGVVPVPRFRCGGRRCSGQAANASDGGEVPEVKLWSGIIWEPVFQKAMVESVRLYRLLQSRSLAVGRGYGAVRRAARSVYVQCVSIFAVTAGVADGQRAVVPSELLSTTVRRSGADNVQNCGRLRVRLCRR